MSGPVVDGETLYYGVDVPPPANVFQIHSVKL
jgi:hypothetical protein